MAKYTVSFIDQIIFSEICNYEYLYMFLVCFHTIFNVCLFLTIYLKNKFLTF